MKFKISLKAQGKIADLQAHLKCNIFKEIARFKQIGKLWRVGMWEKKEQKC